MNQNRFPYFADGEFGFSPFPSASSSPDIDISGPPSSHGAEGDIILPNGAHWDSDWIDLGGEG